MDLGPTSSRRPAPGAIEATTRPSAPPTAHLRGGRRPVAERAGAAMAAHMIDVQRRIRRAELDAKVRDASASAWSALTARAADEDVPER